MPVSIMPMPDVSSPYESFMGGINAIQQMRSAEAKINLENAKAMIPGGGDYAPGYAGQIQGLEMIKTKFGENSPQYAMALNAFKLDQNRQQSGIDFQQQNLDLKGLGPAEKAQAIANGYKITSLKGNLPYTIGNIPSNVTPPPGIKIGTTDAPITDVSSLPTLPLTDSQKQNAINNAKQEGFQDLNNASMRDTAASDVQKKITTAKTLDSRTKEASVENLMNTISDKDLDDVLQYSGIGGKAKALMETGKGALGSLGFNYHQSPEYSKYFTFTHQTLPILMNEVRTALGGQATDYEAKLFSLVGNPATWEQNPQLGKDSFQALKLALQQNRKALAQSNNQTLNQLKSDETATNAQPNNQPVSSGKTFKYNPSTKDFY
jgi:hypothetical protein